MAKKIPTAAEASAKRAADKAAQPTPPTPPDPTCNLRPLGNKVIVKRDEAAKMTPSGIHLVEGQSKETPRRGTVLAIGPEVQSARSLARKAGMDPMLAAKQDDAALAVGDLVYFNAYAGSDLKVGEQTLLILTEDDILAVETLKK